MQSGIELAKSGVWAWETFLKPIITKGTRALKDRWNDFNWTAASQAYRAKLRQEHSRIRVIGKAEPIDLDGIYTDVFMLERPSSWNAMDLLALTENLPRPAGMESESHRVDAFDVLREEAFLFVLGKPGAGKTTFLKHLTLIACDRADPTIDKLPVFVSLHEWSQSGLSLFDFIKRELNICRFPDTDTLLKNMLETGRVLALFDGLDEVSDTNDKRNQVIGEIRDFVKAYSDSGSHGQNRFVITCRNAVTDYVFERFRYVEIADFTDAQVAEFARHWFADEESKRKSFMDALEEPGNESFVELARTPLLLSLMCLGFESTLQFPLRRVDLYYEATQALLGKWDATRNIKRDEIYQALSIDRKRQLLSTVASEYFQEGRIYFREDQLAIRLQAFVERLPNPNNALVPDGRAILKSIEGQHGLLVERAKGIYSFSHLTLQEYFTAVYTAAHLGDGSFARLVELFVSDYRWREVLLMTCSMPDEADALMKQFLDVIATFVKGDPLLDSALNWIEVKVGKEVRFSNSQAVRRALAIDTGLRGDAGLEVTRKLVATLGDPSLDLEVAKLHSDLETSQSIGKQNTPYDRSRGLIKLDLRLKEFIQVSSERNQRRSFALHEEVIREATNLGLTKFVQDFAQISFPTAVARAQTWHQYSALVGVVCAEHGRVWTSGPMRLLEYVNLVFMFAECWRTTALTRRSYWADTLFRGMLDGKLT